MTLTLYNLSLLELHFLRFSMIFSYILYLWLPFWFPSSAWLLISNFLLKQDPNCRLPEARGFLAQCGLCYSSILPILQPARDHSLCLPKVGLVASVHHYLVTWLLLHLISFKYCISGSKTGFMRTMRDWAKL